MPRIVLASQSQSRKRLLEGAGLHATVVVSHVDEETDFFNAMSPTDMVIALAIAKAHTVRELIDYAKKEGGKLNYGSAGPGTGPHLAGELFKRMTGVEMTHVGYKGAAPAVLDIVAGQIQVSFLNITPQVPHVKAGKLRALAVTGAHRSALLPDVPTANESALPGYITESWNGIMTSGGTPRSVIDTLSRAMLRVMATDNMKNRMMTLGADVTPLGPDEFTAYVKADDKRLTPIIKSLDMKSN